MPLLILLLLLNIDRGNYYNYFTLVVVLIMTHELMYIYIDFVHVLL